MANDTWYISQRLKDIDKKIASNLEDAGTFLVAQTKDEIQSMGAVKTGKLKDSIDYSVNKSQLELRVGTGVEYSIFVELGTYKMPPRPFLRYALYKNTDKIRGIISK